MKMHFRPASLLLLALLTLNPLTAPRAADRHRVGLHSVDLAIGQVTSGVLSFPGRQDRYTFRGAAGQRLYYDGLDLTYGSLYVRLVSPVGIVLWEVNHSADVGPFTLVETGTYTLILDGGGDVTDTYQFRLLDVADAAPAPTGQAIHGRLAPRTQTALYQFRGAAGQRVKFASVAATSGDANWRLVNPANQTMLSANITADLGTVLLPLTGQYVVLVEGTARGAFPLDYWLSVTDVSEPAVAPAGFGVVQTGTIAPGEVKTINYQGTAGLPIFFDNLRRDYQLLSLELRASDGTLIFSAGGWNYDTGPYVLPRSGAYTLTVRGFDANSSGEFKFRLLDLTSDAPTVTAGQVVGQAFSEGYQTDVYRFIGASGQRILYDGLEADYDDVIAYLVAPAGNAPLGGANADSDAGPVTLADAGVYSLVVESRQPALTDYRFRLLDAAQAPTEDVTVGDLRGAGPGRGPRGGRQLHLRQPALPARRGRLARLPGGGGHARRRGD